LGIVQYGLLVAVRHRAHFGVAGAAGDYVEDGLETHHEVGGLDRLTASEGEHVGIAGAHAHDGHFDCCV